MALMRRGNSTWEYATTKSDQNLHYERIVDFKKIMWHMFIFWMGVLSRTSMNKSDVILTPKKWFSWTCDEWQVFRSFHDSLLQVTTSLTFWRGLQLNLNIGTSTFSTVSWVNNFYILCNKTWWLLIHAVFISWENTLSSLRPISFIQVLWAQWRSSAWWLLGSFSPTECR